jgi:predicted nucleotidyltransferase
MATSPKDLALAREFARRLAGALGERSFTVTLYGSRARGGADEESDLDLFVALDDDDLGGRVRSAALDVACDLTLECGVLVSAFVADRAFLARRKGFSFLEAVEREGVRV